VAWWENIFIKNVFNMWKHLYNKKSDYILMEPGNYRNIYCLLVSFTPPEKYV
jgi:hypothetical protein